MFVTQAESKPLRRILLALRSHSRLFSYLLYETHPRLRAKLAAPTPGKPAPAEPGLSDFEIFRQPDSSDPFFRAWAVTERLAMEMARLCVANKAGFLIIGVTSHIQVDGASRRNIPEGFDPFYPDKRMIEFGKREGIEYLPLAPVFAETNDKTGALFHGSTSRPGGHWNRVGHDSAAKEIQRIIREKPELLGGAGSR